MQSRSIGGQDNPLVPLHSRMRAFDRDLIRGGHYGQRSCEPHPKAEHMAAPTQACYVRFSLPTRNRPHMAQRVDCCDANVRTRSERSGHTTGIARLLIRRV
jgi:hypothetical protein